jgi:hypothetical protein
MSTLSAVEAIWLLVTLLGMDASRVNLADAMDSYQVARKAGSNQLAKQLVAFEHVRMEITYLLTHLLFLVIGLVAAFSYAVPDSIFLQAAFFIVQIAMIVNSWIVRRDRKYLMAQRLIVDNATRLRPETIAILERLAAKSEALEKQLAEESPVIEDKHQE